MPLTRARILLAVVGLLAVAPPSLDLIPDAPAQGLAQPVPPPIIQPEPAVESVEPQAVKAFPEPDPSEAVTSLLAQTYLTDAERHELRLRHGVWTDADLAAPADRARAALTRGCYWDPSLADPAADPLDRAEAALRLGDSATSLQLTADPASPRATRIRAEALLSIGKTEDALALLRPLAAAEPATADDIAETVWGLLLLARLEGPRAPGAVGYQPMLARLAHARDEVDRLSWRANLVEAMLLYEKDRYAATGEALQSTLTLNPRAADAWAILGMAAVDGFDFPRAEAVAARLDALAGEGGSPDAAIIRAACRLRQSEGDAAERELAPFVTRFPAHRRLLAWHAAAAAGRFDFAQADARLAAIDALAPGQPQAALVVGKAMAGARQYDEASKYLRAAAARWPQWAEPVVELGLSEMQAGRLPEATQALERAAELDQYNVRADNSLKLLHELRAYATIESDHFLIRFKPGVDEVLAREMPPVLERIHARVTGSGPGAIDHVPASKTVVELYPDHHWFSVRITGMPQLHTIAAATGPVIAMEAPREGPGHKAGPYDWARVVQHEFTHTVTLSRTKNRLPHWFTEAGAVLLEDAPRDYNTVQLLAGAYDAEALFNLDDINIAFVRPKKPSDRQLAYAQGHWMYEFIITRWGNQAPLKLMDLYANGVREAEAFQQVLGVPRETFLTDFHAWAGERLIEWGVRETDASPSIRTLLHDEGADETTPALIQKWLAAHPDNPAVLEQAIREREAAGSGRIAPADVDLCQRYARARPVDPRPHKLLAAYFLASAQTAGAIEHLEWLDAREQSSPGLASELARLYAASGDLPRAAAKAARAVQVSPYDARVRELAATIALRAKDFDAAERHLRALRLIEPDREVHQQRLDALARLRASESK